MGKKTRIDLMKLVVDTNVLFTIFLNPRIINKFKDLYSRGIELVISEFVLNELYNLKNKAKKRGISEKEFNRLIEFLLSIFIVVRDEIYRPFLKEATKISPHKKDAPLFALSLAFNKAPIWSREPKLKRQKVIEVLNDKEVEERFIKNFTKGN